jgi:hypothetical protein
MWICKKCGENIDDQFDSCWKCSAPKGGPPATPENQSGMPPKWRLTYRMFRGTLATWEQLFNEAAAFATEVGPDRIVNVSHSADHRDGVVVVWYLTTEDDNPSA